MTDTDNFGWGPYVRSIQVSATDYKSLLEDMRRQAYKTWGKHDAIFADVVPAAQVLETIAPSNVNLPHLEAFYNRVKTKMIAKRIRGYLKKDDIEVLKTSRDTISWKGTSGIVEEDGPTMLWLFLNQCNPST